MKTSFYFVLWILIYPLLDLFHSEVIYNHSFFFALIIVFATSWLLNRAMPNTLLYEKYSRTAPVLEEVFTGNVRAFSKRLFRDVIIEIVISLYFLLTTTVIAVAIFKFRTPDWFAFLVFTFFVIAAVVRSGRLLSAFFKLKKNPTPEECMEIAEDTYKLDYASYYEARMVSDYNATFPPRPRHFKILQIFSIIIASLSILFGLGFILMGRLMITTVDAFELGALGGTCFLYGSLATYFGAKDIVTIVKALKRRKDIMGNTSVLASS